MTPFDDTLAARRCEDISEHNRIEDRKRADPESEFYRSTERRVRPTRTFRCPTCRAEHLREIPAHVCPPTSWRVIVGYAALGCVLTLAIIFSLLTVWTPGP